MSVEGRPRLIRIRPSRADRQSRRFRTIQGRHDRHAQVLADALGISLETLRQWGRDDAYRRSLMAA
jgi:hypothetical protein